MTHSSVRTQGRVDRESRLNLPEAKTVQEIGREMAGLPWTREKVVGKVRRRLPFTEWVPAYRVKEDLVADLITGLTLIVIHIPTSLAYSNLAGVTPNLGLYTAFYAPIVYIFFGTSKHVAIGEISSVAMMLGSAVYTICPGGTDDEKNQVALSLTFYIGLTQFVLWSLGLGVISILLSPTVTSAFSFGIAVQIATSQLSKVFGVQIPTVLDPGKTVKTWYEIGNHWDTSNLCAFLFAVSGAIALLIGKEINQSKRFKSLSPVPIPSELIIVAVATVVTVLTGWDDRYGMAVVGEIQQGFQTPSVPAEISNLQLWIKAMPMALVSYSLTISMGNILAAKHGYGTDGEQELLAVGVVNLFGGFFGAFAAGAGGSRSFVQDEVGGKTQIASLVSSSGLLFVILFLGFLFKQVPTSILGVIIIISLKSPFKQYAMVPKLWKQDKYDLVIWMITAAGVSLWAIDDGLFLGITVAIVLSHIRSRRPGFTELEYSKVSSLYVPKDLYSQTDPSEDTIVLRWSKNLDFFTMGQFLEQVKTIISQHRPPSEETTEDTNLTHIKVTRSLSNVTEKTPEEPELRTHDLKNIIIDVSRVVYVDYNGVQTLKKLHSLLKGDNIRPFFVADCNRAVLEPLAAIFTESDIYPTLQDADQASRSQLYNTIQ